MKESTALGAALAGALGAGVFTTLKDIQLDKGIVEYIPKSTASERQVKMKKWKRAIEKSFY